MKKNNRMRKIDEHDLIRIQLASLREIDTFCHENGIRYYLAYGTLLGAVRHKGYIPWDDDIDIMMPRPDYVKFIKTFNGFSGTHKVISHLLDPVYPWPFAKVIDTDTVMEEHIKYAYKDMGVYVDIFPVDGVSDDKKKILRQYRYVKLLKLLLSVKRGKKFRSRKPWQNFLLNFSFLLSFISYPKLLKKLDSLVSKYPFEKSENTAILVMAGYGKNEIMPKSFYDEPVNLEFEESSFQAPGEYKKWLEHIYGDYMTLPPVEERITHHANNAYYKE